MRSFLLWPVMCVALAVAIVPIARPALAQAAAPAATAAAVAGGDQKFIQDLGNQAIAIVSDKSLTQDQRNQKYRDILQSAFDMQTIGHFVLGRAWNTATPEKQEEFMKLFQQIVLKTYGDRMNFYSGEGFQVKGERKEDDKDTVVNSEITHKDGTPPTKVDWRVRDSGGQPKIVDVSVEGVSQSVTQRQEYASILQRNNGNIDALLDMMRKNLQQSGGSQAQ